MTERYKAGMYLVGEKEAQRREPKAEVGVVKGEVANETRSLGLDAHMGMAKTSWFVFETTEYLYNYADRSGTGVLDVTRMISEEKTKKEAVKKAERRCDELY